MESGYVKKDKYKAIYVFPDGKTKETELTYDEVREMAQPGITLFKEPVRIHIFPDDFLKTEG